MILAACLVLNIGIASAASYTITWANQLNAFSSSANGACSSVKTEILLAGMVLASTNITPPAAGQVIWITLTTLVPGDTIRHTATCTLKDYKGNTVTGTKTVTDIAYDGVTVPAYVMPSPYNWKWTDFIIYYKADSWPAE
ncbi:MAG: hypothetical protein K4571_17280 [Deltaproteobacteria bacterium]